MIAEKICPVSYQSGKPHAAETPHVHEGHTYHLTNQEVVDMFQASPANFLPQFGGFCATALTMGVKAPVDWQQFTIDQDKLYLFHTEDAKTTWESDAALKDAACKMW